MKYLVRACKERKSYVEYLQKYIPNLIVIWDTTNNAMNTFLEAMNYSDSPTVHLEDDIVLTRNFIHKITQVIQSQESQVIQFFSMRKADIEIGSRFENGSTFLMNQCFYLPQEMGLEIAKHYDQWKDKEKHPTGYDLLIADYLKVNKLKYFLYVPSLVQHRECTSLINKKRSSKRQSITFQDGIYE